MPLQAEALSMRARMPWNVGQKVLSSLGLPRGKGWEHTVTRLSQDNPIFPEKQDELRSALIEHYQCGEKLSRFYRLPLGAMATLRETLRAAQPGASDFAPAWPLMVNEGELQSAPTAPTLLAVVETEDGITGIYASVRVLTVRTEVDASEFPDEIASALTGYDELIGVRHIRWQAMDIIHVPSQGDIIDVRVDFPVGMLQSTGDYCHSILMGQIRSIVGPTAMAPVNLFPLIESMYSVSTEGLVVELAFGTTTASLKNEKMRRRRTCLRQEAYHVGGKQALASPIDIHRLSVVWELPMGGERLARPELTLAAPARSAGSAAPRLETAIIRNCTGVRDYDHVRARMMSYLTAAG